MVGFDNLIPETHGTLFHSAQTVTVTGKVTPREVIVETYQNTSRAEYVFRVVQSVCTLLVFIITIANYVSTQDDPEVNKSWWNYVLILVSPSLPLSCPRSAGGQTANNGNGCSAAPPFPFLSTSALWKAMSYSMLERGDSS